jgi:hypothetical protein
MLPAKPIAAVITGRCQLPVFVNTGLESGWGAPSPRSAVSLRLTGATAKSLRRDPGWSLRAQAWNMR